MKKSYKFIALTVALIVSYFGCFWLLFNYEFVGSDTSFIFQIVVAMMSTGLLAIVTGFMFIFQSQIESRKENKTKIFEKKIEFYYEVINELETVFKDEVIDENVHSMLFLVSKSMIVASPEVAEKFANLHLSVISQTSIPQAMKELIASMRKDLDLLDNIKEDHSAQFESILGRLEPSIAEETTKFRRRSDEEKAEIIRQYDAVKNNKVTWLKENYNITPAYIATWRKKVL